MDVATLGSNHIACTRMNMRRSWRDRKQAIWRVLGIQNPTDEDEGEALDSYLARLHTQHDPGKNEYLLVKQRLKYSYSILVGNQSSQIHKSRSIQSRCIGARPIWIGTGHYSCQVTFYVILIVTYKVDMVRCKLNNKLYVRKSVEKRVVARNPSVCWL
jgi:hypothetical protein